MQHNCGLRQQCSETDDAFGIRRYAFELQAIWLHYGAFVDKHQRQRSSFGIAKPKLCSYKMKAMSFIIDVFETALKAPLKTLHVSTMMSTYHDWVRPVPLVMPEQCLRLFLSSDQGHMEVFDVRLTDLRAFCERRTVNFQSLKSSLGTMLTSLNVAFPATAARSKACMYDYIDFLITGVVIPFDRSDAMNARIHGCQHVDLSAVFGISESSAVEPCRVLPLGWQWGVSCNPSYNLSCDAPACHNAGDADDIRVLPCGHTMHKRHLMMGNCVICINALEHVVKKWKEKADHVVNHNDEQEPAEEVAPGDDEDIEMQYVDESVAPLSQSIIDDTICAATQRIIEWDMDK